MIVICASKNCRRSYSSRFRLYLHQIIRHGKGSNSYYIANDELIICSNPKSCNTFFSEDNNSVNIDLVEKDIDRLIEQDTYIMSHVHNSKFKHHLLIILIGRGYTIPDGPFLGKFEQKGTVITLPISFGDLQYLKKDLKNNTLEFDEIETKGIIKVWLSSIEKN